METWRFYSCPIFTEDGAYGFDVRMFSETHPWLFGQPYDVDALFIDTEQARRHFLAGTKFTIWEGRTIGFGEVLKATWEWPRRNLP